MFKKLRTSTKKKGFTLIELLITISIGAVIVALVVPNLLGARTQADAGMASTLENQLNSVYAQWSSLGGVVGPSTDPGAQTEALLDVLTSAASDYEDVASASSTDDAVSDGPRSGDPVNSSAIRTQLNDGAYAPNTGSTGVEYSNFLIAFDGSSFSVSVN